MSWARRRKASIAIGIVFSLMALTALGWYTFIYEPPSCTDGIQNQDERGVDCEGACDRMCTFPRVDALWSRAVKTADGVYHGVALVKNPLPNAKGTRLSYTMSLYDSGNILVAERRGAFSLSPGETRVIFEPNIVTGERIPVRAFMKIDGGLWERSDPVQQTVRIIPGTVDEETLTLDATLENTTPAAVSNLVVDALLFDADGVLVTASESRVPTIAARARQDVTFTWPEAFPVPVTTWDILVRLDAVP